MINTEAIRNKILDLAIRGELTQQLSEDGNAGELYQQIQEEKERLAKDGKIKKSQVGGSLSANGRPEGGAHTSQTRNSISSDQVPFEVPENWMWVRLGDVLYIVRGGSPRPIKQYLTTNDNGINWIKIGDVERGGKYILETKEKIIPEGETKSRKVYPGDFLLTNSMSFGRPYISKIEGCIHDGWLLLHNFNGFEQDYLYYLLSSKYLYEQFTQKASGSTVENLNIDKVNSAVVPLPPIPEQNRIVKKVEELFALLDKIDSLQSAYISNRDALKRKLIDAGIRGKLTRQLPEDGTAEELYGQIQEEKKRLIEEGKIKKTKPLPEVTEEEIPFEIPENWKWVRLGNLAYLTSGGQYEEAEKGIPYVKVSDMNHPDNKIEIVTMTRYTSEDNLGIIPIGSIIFPKRGGAIATNKKRLVTKQPIYVDTNTMGMTMILIDILPFMKYWFDSLDLSSIQTGTSVPQINNKDLYPLLVPLPPLKEQRRISDRIEEYMKAMQIENSEVSS